MQTSPTASLEREKEMGVFYRGEHIGTRRVDFFVEEKIMVELKALVALEDVSRFCTSGI